MWHRGGYHLDGRAPWAQTRSEGPDSSRWVHPDWPHQSVTRRDLNCLRALSAQDAAHGDDTAAPSSVADGAAGVQGADPSHARRAGAPPRHGNAEACARGHHAPLGDGHAASRALSHAGPFRHSVVAPDVPSDTTAYGDDPAEPDVLGDATPVSHAVADVGSAMRPRLTACRDLSNRVRDDGMRLSN